MVTVSCSVKMLNGSSPTPLTSADLDKVAKGTQQCGHKIFDMLSRKIISLLVYKQTFDFELGLPGITQKSQKLVLP